MYSWCSSMSGFYEDIYYASLLFVKNDGSLWVRGSNMNGMFGPGDTTSAIRLLDGVKRIYSGIGTVSALTESGELLRWDAGAPTEDGSPKLIAENVVEGADTNLFYFVEGGVLYADNGEKRTAVAENVRCFSAGLLSVVVTLNDGTAKYYTADICEYEQGELVFTESPHVESDVAYCGIGSMLVFALKEDGTLYASGMGAWEEMHRTISNVSSAFASGLDLFDITNDGKLQYVKFDSLRTYDGVETIAEDVVLCKPFGGVAECLYVTADGGLHFYSSISENRDYQLPAVPTANPLENATVLYGGSSSISLPAEPDVGETKLLGAFTDEILDRAAEDGNVFAVTIGVGHIDCDAALRSRINALTADGPIFERYAKRGEWESRFTELYGIADYLELIDRYHPEGFELLFDDYWAKHATEEERKAYEDAIAERDELYRQAYGEATRAEAERLKALGLAVEYDGSWHITGVLTAEQIRNFPAGEDHSFYIEWQVDPELTAEKIIAAEGLNEPA